jgi:ABC-2 type transport system permease protein
MRNTLAILRRELAGYFSTPLAYVFLVIFLLLAGMATFNRDQGNLLGRGQADLIPFFSFHPMLYLFLVPSISMRLWAEERKTGTIELLLTLPVSVTEAVLGKFLGAWCFTAIALLLTTPVWITVNYLGQPDNGVILAGYLGSLLMAGSYLAIGACISALTRNQVIAFVISITVCYLFVLAGHPTVVDFFRGWAPQAAVDVIASLGFLTHFDSITKGVIDLRDMVFFVSLMAFFLFANAVVLDLRKAE